ncbi:MAG: Tat pathway signal protein [Hyphomicrobiales bacterium]|nr:Tat pathway signal protein [Hyphomicrobiales bacterium]
MLTRRSMIFGIAGACAATFFPAHAQTYPDKAVKLVVPYAAGGGTDAIARLVAQAVSEQLGQTIIVENNGTAGGNVASQQVAAAPADGYTVLMANQGPMVVNPHLFKSMKLDPLQAFDPVTLITSAPLVLVVPAKSKLTSFKQFLEEAKASSGKLSYGSAGNGSASHLAVILLAQVAGLEFAHVPYRGAGPALNDLVSGQTDFMITTMPSVMGQIEGGIVKALAVTTKDRTKKLPAVPTIAESGFAQYDTGAWYGFVVPKGTPASIIATLRKATVAAINKDVIKARFANEGAEPIGSEPAEFAAMMQSESRRWADVIGKTKIELN